MFFSFCKFYYANIIIIFIRLIGRRLRRRDELKFVFLFITDQFVREKRVWKKQITYYCNSLFSRIWLFCISLFYQISRFFLFWINLFMNYVGVEKSARIIFFTGVFSLLKDISDVRMFNFFLYLSDKQNLFVSLIIFLYFFPRIYYN